MNSKPSSSKFPTAVKKPVDQTVANNRKARGSAHLGESIAPKISVIMKNDGRVDLLTKTITPSSFIRNLRKTLALIDRGLLKPNLVIVTFRIFGEVPESEILELSEDIARSIRDSDYFARMSTRGFWVVLHGTESECEIAVARIHRIRKKEAPDYRAQIMIKLSNESRVEWLNRIDATYFQTP